MTSLVPPSDTDPLVLPAQLASERTHDAEADREDTGTEPLWRRFAHDRLAVAALAFLVVLIGLAIAAPLVSPYRPDAQDLNAINAGPSGAHWFGTDDLGRDILSRLIWGARVSLRAAFEIVALAIVVALPIGLVAGTVRGWFDSVVMRLMDALFSFPPLVLALTVAALLGPDLNDAAVAIAIVFVPSFVRLIRGEVISVREETYIESSHALGVRPSRLIRSHILPNVASPIVIQVALALGFALLAEAGLSFLGVGEQPPTPSWGTMLSEAYQFIFTNPLALVFPGLAIMITVLSFNLVADGLRDALGRQRTLSPKAVASLVRRLRNAVRRRPAGSDSPAAIVPVAGAVPVAEPVPVAPAVGSALLSVRGVQVDFAMDGAWVPVVEDVSFAVLPGQTVGLVGESGSGKTVSALAVMGLLPSGARLAAGSVHFAGRELTTMGDRELRTLRGNDVAMIFQEPMTSLNPAYSVGNQIAEQVRVHRGLSRKESWRVAVEMLDRVEIPNAAQRAHEYPHLFSGGMRQRVMIAMALSCSPKLLIADEPTTALDVTTQAQIIDLLRTLLDEQQMSMIFVTHDLGVIADVADQVVVMYAGQVVEQAEVGRLYGRPRHPYTEALMASIPQLTPRGEPLHAIPGVVPRPREFTPSCRFVLRCDHATDPCWSAPTRLEGPAGADATVGGHDVPHLSRCIRQDELVLRNGPEGVATRVHFGHAPAPAATATPVLTTTDLRKEFPIRSGVLRTVSGSVAAVDGVSLSIDQGTTLGLVGESGSGKSTLARLIMRLIDPSAGSVIVDGTDLTSLSGAGLREQRHLLQMVFQDPYSSLDPRHTIGDTVAEPLRTHRRMSPGEVDARVVELLARVGMVPSALRRHPHQFSGGQRQRVAIARALAVDPKLLVCDEAVSALDVSTQAQVINLLRDLQQTLGTGYLFIAHDLSVVRHISDRIAVMYLGRVVEEGPAEAVYGQPAHPYTAALLSAIPVPDPVGRESRRRVVLRGEVGDATAERQAGCPFRSRCAYAMDICGQVDPEPYLTPVGTTVRCHLHTEGPALGGESVLSLGSALAPS